MSLTKKRASFRTAMMSLSLNRLYLRGPRGTEGEKYPVRRFKQRTGSQERGGRISERIENHR